MPTVVLERWLESSTILSLSTCFYNSLPPYQTQYYGNIQSYFIKLWKLSKNQYIVWTEGVITNSVKLLNCMRIFHMPLSLPLSCLLVGRPHFFLGKLCCGMKEDAPRFWSHLVSFRVECQKWRHQLSKCRWNWVLLFQFPLPIREKASYHLISFPKKASTLCHVSIYFLIIWRKGRTLVIMTLTLPLAK